MSTDPRSIEPHPVEWRQGFKVHVGQIDQEHEHLFKVVALLDHSNIEALLPDVISGIETHFKHELALMHQADYPRAEENRALHEAFCQRFHQFLDERSGWDEARVQALRRFLSKNLIAHIMVHDLRFGHWYRATHGEEAARNAALATGMPKAIDWVERLLSGLIPARKDAPPDTGPGALPQAS